MEYLARLLRDATGRKSRSGMLDPSPPKQRKGSTDMSNDGPNPDVERLAAGMRGSFSLDGQTEQLRTEDYELIGRFIQVYCVSDYTARRVITAMRHIASVAEMDSSKLSDKDVIEHLHKCGESWKVQDGGSEWIQSVAKTLEMHHHLRHSFAHFAARRMKDENVLFLLTTSAKHKDPPTGIKIETNIPERMTEGSHLASFRLIPLQELREELVRLQQNAQALSEFAHHLETNLVRLKAAHSQPE